MDPAAIFPVLTIIVGGACVLMLVSTKTLRESRDDQEKRIKQLEEERVRDKETIASQAGELVIWQNAVTGQEQLRVLIELVTQLTALLTEHHTEATTNWDQVGKILKHMDETQAALVTAAIRKRGET